MHRHPQPAPPVLAPPRYPRRDARLALATVAWSAAGGALLELLAPANQPLAVAAGAVACAATLAAPRLRLLAGTTRFAAAVVGGIAALVAAGSFVPAGGIPGGATFCALVGLLAAGVVAGAVSRWRDGRRDAGHLLCHAGVLLVIAGTALSMLLAERGRLVLQSGSPPLAIAAGVAISLSPPPAATPEPRLVVYDRRDSRAPRRRASFSAELGAEHRLPDGARFRVADTLAAVAPRAPAIVVELEDGGGRRAAILHEGQNDAIFFGDGKVLAYERGVAETPPELIIVVDGRARHAAIADGCPARARYWTLLLADAPATGAVIVDAVRDPGAPWVLAGLGALAAGVMSLAGVAPWRARGRA